MSLYKDDVVQPVLLRAEQVCKMIGFCRSKVYSMLEDGTIPSVRIGEGTLRVRKADLDAWIENLPKTVPKVRTTPPTAPEPRKKAA